MDQVKTQRQRRARKSGEASANGERSETRAARDGERTQAEQHAKQARRKVQERRDQQSGVAGWVSDRASQWTLDGPDWNFLEPQKYLWNPLMDYYFRMEVDGWEHIPPAPALLIGIHSGAPFVWDAWTVGMQWWRQFGRSRPLHGTAHDMLMATPMIGWYFRKMGVLPAAPDSISAALAAGRDVILWPGGERDSLRHWTQRDDAVLAGRKGFVRLAIRSGVPIVPVATVGGPDSMPVLATGRRLAKLLRLDQVARLKMFPIALQVPWGVSPAILPEIPLPTKIRTEFRKPIEFESDPELADDDDYVSAKYDEVRSSIQNGMHKLARRRRLPVLG